MAQAYGSLAHPVDLGPFSRIVEVHWAPPYIAASLDISVTTVFEVEMGPAFGPIYVEPFTFYSTTLATYAFHDPPLGSFQRFSGGSWRSLSGSVTIGGEPSLPGPYTYPKWQWQGIDGFGLKEPFVRFGAGEEGEELPIPVPGHGSEQFTDSLAGNVVLAAQGFVPGGPYNDPGGNETHELWATAQATEVDVSIPRAIPTIQDAETASLSVAGMTIEHGGKTYVAIGTKVIAPETGTYDRGQFWVLFKRQDVTA